MGRRVRKSSKSTATQCPFRVRLRHLGLAADVRFTPSSGHQATIGACPFRANTGSGGLCFKLGAPRMSGREPSILITIVITAGRKCPTFTMILAYIRQRLLGQDNANGN